MQLAKQPYRGTRDFFPPQMRQRDFLFARMKVMAERHAFEGYDGPLLEEVDLYKAKSGEELINDQIYGFIDRGERHVAIRPEMTPTLARMVAQVHRELPKPLRWYAIPNLMRYEKPQKGRLREHWQFNADIFGAPEFVGELEILQLLISFLQSFGANEKHFEVLINDRSVVDLIFNQYLKLTPEKSYKLYKVIDKAKKVSPEALQKMLSEILLPEQINFFETYLSLKTFSELELFLEKHQLKEQVIKFFLLVEKFEQWGLSSYLTYDPTIVRGLDYYTGLVFEVFDKHPDNRRAIAGGGAYGNLLQIFNEDPLAGVGFGMGDVTLADFLQTHQLMPSFEKVDIDVLISFMDPSCEAFAQSWTRLLRNQGIKTECYPEASKPKKIFSYAQKRGYQAVAIIGTDEMNKNEVPLKFQNKDQTIILNNQNITELKKYFY